MKNGTPRGWASCKFGDIARIRNGYAFKSASFKKSKELETDVPLIRQSQLSGPVADISDAVYLDASYLAEFPSYKIEEGDVLIGMSGSIGKVCTYKESIVALQNQRTGKIELHSKADLHPRFLGLYLSSIERTLVEFAKGMGVQNISGKDVEALPFPLCPLAEQRRIVAKIEELFSELDKGIENLKQARAQLTVYRQALLKHAFEGKLTADWRKANAHKLEPAPGGNVGMLPQLPTCWAWQPLGHISSVSGGLTKNPKRDSLARKMKYLRVGNVYADRLDLDDVREIGVTDDEAERLALKKGDLLVVEGNGSVEQIGRVAEWMGSIPKCGHQNHLIRARLHATVMPRFTLRFLQSPLGRDAIVKAASSTSGLHTLSISKVADLTIPVAPLPEQQVLLDVIEPALDYLTALESDIETNLQKSEALRQSILKKAFAGELVPQDPADEPAAELLARIRLSQSQASANAERAATAQTTTGGGRHSVRAAPEKPKPGRGRLARPARTSVRAKLVSPLALLPEGELKIAHGFNRGKPRHRSSKSRRDG